MVSVFAHCSTYSFDYLYCRPPPLIIVSVEYSLAPEHPFPAAIIDALSAVEFILDGNPSRNIHIGGVSAGGHVALVAGLEAFRKYPGRISRYVGYCCLYVWLIWKIHSQ
jgi:acetyl esterase/lipase